MGRILVVFTGGTISMQAAPDGGNVPTLRGADLIARLGDAGSLPEIEPLDWGLVPASHLRLAQVLEVGRLLDEHLRRPGIDGAVVVQGTDVLDETAFAWDLLPLPAKPAVVVGAMRSASQNGYDGTDNLRNALVAAADPGLATEGVVVAMDGEIHGADLVAKTNTHAYGTFKSPDGGPLAYVRGPEVVRLRARVSRTRLPAIPREPALPVPIVGAVLDGDEAAARRQVAGARAVVMEATGGGNTPAWMLAIARVLIGDGVPVVLTTRVPTGRVAPGYGFDGGSTRWWEAGVLFGGYLESRKARLVLSLGLGAGVAPNDLSALFRPFGGGSIADGA